MTKETSSEFDDTFTSSDANTPVEARILSEDDRQLALESIDMPYEYPDQFWKLIPRYCDEMKKRLLSETYIKENERVLRKTHELFRRSGRHLNPRDFNENDIYFYLDSLSGKWKYREQCFLILRQFLQFCGNDVAVKLKIRFPKDDTTNADWLEPKEIAHVRKFANDSLEDLLMELGFNNGARRIACFRLTKQDALNCIRTGILTLKGKGPMGGEARSFSAHPETIEKLEKYLDWRQNLLETMAKEPYEEPKELFIYVKNGVPRTYRLSGLAKKLRVLSKKTGIHFSYHTMRRSFGRQMDKAGAELTVIKKIMGHKSLEQTIRYLGLNINDTSDAMRIFADFQEKNGFKYENLN